MGAGYKASGTSKGSEWAACASTMAERVVYPVHFSTPKIDEDGNEYVDYTDVQNFQGPSRYGEEFPISGRCVDAKDPITTEPYDPGRPGLVLQPERGPGHCFQDEPGETGVIQSIWNTGNPSTRKALSDENRAYLESKMAPPYPWQKMRLELRNGSSVEIPCDENARVRSRDERIMRTAVHIDVPRGVTTIGEGAFEDCTSLASITLPEGVTEIKSRAFHGCTSLKSIIFPSSVETYGRDILAGCTSLRRVYLANDSGQQQVDVADLGVNPSVVTVYRWFFFRYAIMHDAWRADSDSDEGPPPDRGVSRSLAAAVESDSESDDEPPARRARTEGALYHWTE